jgi:biotin synthase
MTTFARRLDRHVFSYLFCFNAEPDSRMANHPKPPLTRWRRIQLAKSLLEEVGLDSADISAILDELALDGFIAAGPGPTRTQLAPPSAGRTRIP